MMPQWCSTFVYFSLLLIPNTCWSIGVEASGRSKYTEASPHSRIILKSLSFPSTPRIVGILQTVFGVPNECIHQNTVRPCKLTFSCWFQGGKSTQGCGTNKWLFSCCVSEKEPQATVSAVGSKVIYVTGITTSGLGNLEPSSGAQQYKHRPHYAPAKVKRQQTILKNSKFSQSLSNVLRRRTDNGIGEYKVIR